MVRVGGPAFVGVPAAEDGGPSGSASSSAVGSPRLSVRPTGQNESIAESGPFDIPESLRREPWHVVRVRANLNEPDAALLVDLVRGEASRRCKVAGVDTVSWPGHNEEGKRRYDEEHAAVVEWVENQAEAAREHDVRREKRVNIREWANLVLSGIAAVVGGASLVVAIIALHH